MQSPIRTSTSQIEIDAPAVQVWQALTDPKMVRHWQYGSVLTTTWEPGSPIRFTTAWGDQVFEQWGTVIDYKPHSSLKYSLFAPRPGLDDNPENYFFMTYLLTESEGKTRLSIIQHDPRPMARPEPGAGLAEQNNEGVT